MRFAPRLVVTVAAALFVATSVRAETTPDEPSATGMLAQADSAPAGEPEKETPKKERINFRDGDWGLAIAPYLWLPGVTGSITVLDQEGNVDIPFSEILADLNLFLMLNVDARWRDLVLVATPLYVNLGEGVDVGPDRARLGINLWIVDTYAKYGVAFGRDKQHRLEMLAGARYAQFDLGFDIQGSPLRFADDDSWIDAIVGLEYSTLWSEKWEFRTHADVGGFDPSDDMSGKFNAEFGRRIGKRSTFWFGYKLLSIKKNWGSPPTESGVDLFFHGPLLAWEWAF